MRGEARVIDHSAEPTRRRVRIVEWPVPHPPNWELCLPEGAAELGVAVRADDDMIMLYPPGTARAEVERVEALLRHDGYEAVALTRLVGPSTDIGSITSRALGLTPGRRHQAYLV